MDINRIRKLDYDRNILILILLSWGYPLLYYLKKAQGGIPIINLLSVDIDVLLISFFVIFSIKVLSKLLSKKDLLFYFSCILIYGMQYVIYPQNEEFLNEFAYTSLITVIPMYFIGVLIDVNKYDVYLLITSVICTLCVSFYNLIYSDVLISDIVNKDTMGTAYMALPHVLYIVWYTFRHPRVHWILLSVFCLFFMIGLGKRGPLVSIACFSIFYLLANTSIKRKSIILFAIIGVLILTNFDLLITKVDDFLSSYGVHSRITEMFFMGEFADDNGRDYIINQFFDILNNGSSLSYGLFGSYVHGFNYSHRLYVDFWFCFGYFAGTILMAILSYVYYLGYKSCEDTVQRGFWILLFSESVLSLFFSDYFMFNGAFFLFLGYCIKRVRIKKNMIS